MRTIAFSNKTLAALLLATLLAALAGAAPSYAAIRTVIGTVTKVSDGDTVQVVTLEQTKHRVRLYEIDAPETPLWVCEFKDLCTTT